MINSIQLPQQVISVEQVVEDETDRKANEEFEKFEKKLE